MKNKLTSSLLSALSGKFGTMAIQLFTTMVLARFLAPEDFGVVSMCSIFLSISEMLIDSGMAGSIIFHKDVKEIELHTLFWTNLLVSVIIYFILYTTSGWIASFYQVPILESIIKVIGLSSVIHSFCLIQSALLSKEMEFKIQTKIMILSAISSSVVVICLAYFEVGVWALVAQPILLKMFQAFFFIMYGSYKPRFQYSLESLRRHWHFGSRLLGSSVLKLVYDNMYVQVIGRVINLRDAGFYAQAKRFNDIPFSLISFPLERVIFPALANSSNIVERMKRMSAVFTVVIVPVLFLGALLSNNIIVILLGKEWFASGWILSYLFLGTIGASLESLNRNFIKASGKTSILLKFDVIKRVINVLILALGMYWSLKGILIAFIINGFISWAINCYALRLATEYDIKKQVFDVLLISLLAFLPYILINYVLSEINFGLWIDIFWKTTVYSVIYILLTFLFRKHDMKLLIKSLKKIDKK